MTNIVEEIWKDILGYEGLYKITQTGKIKSQRKILKPRKTTSDYLQTALSKGGVIKYYYIHRLVAIAYIPNPDNKPFVNHIDLDTLNNNHWNL